MGEKKSSQEGNFGIGNMEGGSISGNAKVAGVINEIQNFFFGNEGSLAQQELNRRRLLLNQVKKEVKGRLRQSLHYRMEALINLGKELQPEQVRRIWDVDVKIGDRSPISLSRKTEIIEVFDDEDVAGKLLILGAPGSGKTTTMLELAAELIRRAEDDPEEPMPVLFNLSSWKDDKQPISEWLVRELKLKYGARKDIGKNWVEGRRLLPMLDGLDELESTRQELCVEAINQFLQSECRPAFLLVCSRLEEYELYKSRLLLNEAVCLQPLTEVQIEGYLQKCQRPAGLWSTVRKDAALLELVRTPLLLSMTVVAEISMAEWRELRSGEERLSYLLNAYVVRMLRREIDNKVYVGAKMPSAKQTRFWLIWVARQIEREPETEFFIEKMQPFWLNNKCYKQIFALLVGLTFGLIGGTLVSLIIGLNFSDIFSLKTTIFVILFLSVWFGFFFGLWAYLTFGQETEIKPVEDLNLSWFNFRKATILSLISVVTTWILLNLIPEFNQRKFEVIVSMLVGFLSTVMLAMRGSEIEKRRVPNQGIWRSFNHGIFFSIIGAIVVGICAFLASKQTFSIIISIKVESSVTVSSLEPSLADIINITISGMLTGLFTGLTGAGIACIQHFSLRLVLYFSGKIPWNYARFLDYATERGILQRVGGGYRFIHKYLQEHFAGMKL